MYTSIRRFQTTHADEISRVVNEQFVPLISRLPGFVAYYGVIGDGTWTTISVFEDRQGVENSNKVAEDFRRQEHLDDLVEGPPQITVGDVVIQQWREKPEQQERAA